MRTFRKIISFIIILAIFGCSNVRHSLYKYQYYPSKSENFHEIERVFLAPFNTIVKNNEITNNSKNTVGQYIDQYLKLNNFEILPQGDFIESWNNSLNQVGGVYDGISGNFSSVKFLKCLELTTKDLKAKYDFSYIIFPDFITSYEEIDKQSGFAEWRGVWRELPKRGVFKNGWRKAKVASLMVTAFTKDSNLYFRSVGGLDFLQISTKQGRNYTLEMKQSPFDNHEHLAEGVNISLHPLIVYEDYPGPKEDI